MWAGDRCKTCQSNRAKGICLDHPKTQSIGSKRFVFGQPSSNFMLSKNLVVAKIPAHIWQI